MPRQTIPWRALFDRDYETNWHDHVMIMVLRNYRLYHGKVEKAEYLKGTYERHTKFVARLRMGGNRTPVELGRHSNTPLEDRVCDKCNFNQLGDEYHLISLDTLLLRIPNLSRRNFVKI